MSDEWTGKISDENKCTLVCGESIFEADKSILIEKSRYFQAMFTSECKESLTNYIHLHNVKPNILELILKYIEHEEVPQIEGNKDELLALLATSDMFSMTELFESCCCQLPTILKKGNFTEIFSLTKLYNNEKFKTELICFLAVHFQELNDAVGDNIFTLEDIKLLLTNLSNLANISSADVLMFIIQWIKQDIRERQRCLNDLLTLIRMNNLPDDVLEYFVEDESVFENNEISRNYLIEKASVDQINILFHKHKRLKIYNVSSDAWVDAKIIPDHRPILNAFHYGNHFYFITFELNESCCSVFILKYSGDDTLDMLHDFGKIKGKFHVCSIDSAIYITSCELQDMRTGAFKTTVRYYNVVSNERKIVGEKVLSREITDITSSHSHIYMLSTHRTPFLFIVSFNVLLFTWFELINPPSMQELYMEHAVCCQDRLYIFRFFKIKENLTWDPNGPVNKDEFYKALEGKDYSMSTSNGTIIHEISVSKICIFSYDLGTNSWKKKEIEHRWSYSEGFIHFHNRFLKNIPYVYLLLLNRTIVQINPETCEFKEVTVVPDDLYSSLHFPAYYTVFCK